MIAHEFENYQLHLNSILQYNSIQISGRADDIGIMARLWQDVVDRTKAIGDAKVNNFEHKYK